MSQLSDHLEKLHAFKAVAESGSISRAASKLYVSQSSLSHSMMTLEEALRVKLFERKPRGVELTEAGKVLFNFSRRIELDVSTIETRLKEPNDQFSGHLRISTHETLAIHLWPKFLRSLQKSHPKLKVTLLSGRVDAIIERVLGRDYHLGVTVKPLAHPDLNRVPLYSGRFGLYASTSGEPRSYTLSDLKKVPVVTDSHAHIRQGLPIPQYLLGEAIGDPYVYEVNSFEAALRIASEGLGLAAVPTKNAQSAVDQGLVQEVNVEGIAPESFGCYQICASFRKDEASNPLLGLIIERLKMD